MHPTPWKGRLNGFDLSGDTLRGHQLHFIVIACFLNEFQLHGQRVPLKLHLGCFEDFVIELADFETLGPSIGMDRELDRKGILPEYEVSRIALEIVGLRRHRASHHHQKPEQFCKLTHGSKSPW